MERSLPEATRRTLRHRLGFALSGWRYLQHHLSIRMSISSLLQFQQKEITKHSCRQLRPAEFAGKHFLSTSIAFIEALKSFCRAKKEKFFGLIQLRNCCRCFSAGRI